jgi:hypothetical protein
MIFTLGEHGVYPVLGAEVRYEDFIKRAIELGWEVCDCDKAINQNGFKLKRKISDREYTLIWKCRDFWQCADYLLKEDGCLYAQNHRPMSCINDMLKREIAYKVLRGNYEQI